MCVNGDSLPDSGYIQCTVNSSGLPLSTSIEGLFFIVPDSPFNKSTPALTSTNLLDYLIGLCELQYEKQYLQEAPLQTPCHLERYVCKLASVRCAANIVIEP